MPGNAERCKRYRDKKKSSDPEYNKIEAMRKQEQRIKTKFMNPQGHQLRLIKQKHRMKALRARRSVAKEIKRLLETKEDLNSSFTNYAAKCRSVKKVESSLPKSPSKQTEVIRSLAKHYKMTKPATPQVGRRKKTLIPEEFEYVRNFMNRNDITQTAPGRKDHVYMGKINGKSQWEQKRYMLWTIRDTLDILNGTDENITQEDELTFRKKFGKNITFRQLYTFIKMHKQYIFNKDTPHWSCMCEICENMLLLMKGMNTKLKSQINLEVYDICKRFECTNLSDDCMSAQCDECKDSGLKSLDFNLQNHEDRITFKMWTNVNIGDRKSVKKIQMNMEVEDIITKFNKDLITLKLHLYTNKEQHRCYRLIKDNLSDNELMIYVDYSESYKNQEQGEVQSAYFGHQNFSLFTACVYYRKDGELKSLNTVVVSESTDHSRIAAHSCVETVINYAKQKLNLLQPLNIHIISDGCAAQFRSKYIFSLMTDLAQEDTIIWYYNERHHGKGPMDGVGGTLKNIMFRKVKSGEISFETAKDFADNARKICNAIHTIYLPKSDEKVEKDKVLHARAIPQTLKVHKVIRQYNDVDGSWTLQFYKIATDMDPFHSQVYLNQEEEDGCGHVLASAPDDNICPHCCQVYTVDDRDWLRCPLCNQWFHEDCFYL